MTSTTVLVKRYAQVVTLDTRLRMVETAARLFQRDGYHATSWRGLVQEAGAPWGSIHHHFPGGKEELGVAAVAAGKDAVLAGIDHAFASTRSPERAIEALFGQSAALMEHGAFAAGCPVATVALETSRTSPALAGASRAAFVAWEDRLTEHLLGAGVPRRRARALGPLLLTLLDGALVRERVHASLEPLRAAGSHGADLVRAARA